LCTAGLFINSCSEIGNKEEKNNGIKSETSQILADFEMQLKDDVKEDNLGSISTTVFREDQIIWAKTFGKANFGNGVEADTNTIYRAASISKTVAAFLMMLLVQEGTISLSDPIEKFLPEIASVQNTQILDTNRITFRHLASHTSGLSREPNLVDAASGPIEEWEGKVLSSISSTRLNTVPGEKYAYSNIGYGILGLALSRASGKPFIELVHEMVFEPLNMHNSFFIIPEGSDSKVATGYKWHPFTGKVDDQKSQLEHAGRGYKVPNGGIYSTPNDLARFLMAHIVNGGLLSKELMEKMHTIQTPESNKYGYGFCFYIRNNDNGIKMIEHDGGVTGYNAYMVFSPDSKIGVILMRNYNFGRTNILLEPRSLLNQLSQIKKQK